MDHRCWIAISTYAFAAMIDGKVVGRAFSVPFAFNIEGRTELPDGGWDQVIRWAHDDKMIGRTPTALSALEISLLPAARGGGNSTALLGAMRACAKARGFAELFAPVRPNQKHLQPRMPMRDYIVSVRPDGLPVEFLAAHSPAFWRKNRENRALFHDHRRQPRGLVALDGDAI